MVRLAGCRFACGKVAGEQGGKHHAERKEAEKESPRVLRRLAACAQDRFSPASPPLDADFFPCPRVGFFPLVAHLVEGERLAFAVNQGHASYDQIIRLITDFDII